MKRCLLVDGDAGSRARLAPYLQGFDLDVTAVGTAAAMRQHLSHHDIDVVLMDLNLPDANGLALCRWLQEVHRLPLIVMSQGGDLATRVACLEHGADDVVDRPCDLREIVGHVRALLRRTARQPAPEAGGTREAATRWRIAGWVLHADTEALRAPDGRVLRLKPGEARLLQTLAQHPNEPLRRAWLASQLPHTLPATALRQVDLTVASLRHKMQDQPPHCSLILTVRGVGYVLHADVQAL